MGLHDFAVQIGGMLRKTTDLFSINADQSRSPLIPFPMKDIFTRETAYCGMSLGRLVETMQRVPPLAATTVSTAVAFFPVLVNFPCVFGAKYRLYDVGLNPQVVVARGQWHRVVTSQLFTTSVAELLNDVADMYDYGTKIERRWGWSVYYEALTSVNFVGSALYSEF